MVAQERSKDSSDPFSVMELCDAATIWPGSDTVSMKLSLSACFPSPDRSNCNRKLNLRG